MSTAMTPSQNRTTFALQSRLFVAMKRAGRVIDLLWFQQNAEYARAVLDTASRMSDAEVREIGRRLGELLADYLLPERATVLPLRPAPEPVPAPVVPPTPAAPLELDRHLTSLR